ncbi:hypothetical protein [Providencia phage PSTCR5]|uniref:Uncharacterized protein n=1 Tax=Providencia phage PSTCR5 TaxID=2783547 RepID=A0A873WHY6_9CAUD|nr:hypothetical protein KNV68_gp105 [Providencia phage PSTCR5]QPB12203.1 hypothetical protein [Providencia phage PSTCR5]
MSNQLNPQLVMLRGLLATAKALTDPEIVAIASKFAEDAVAPLKAEFAKCAEVDASGEQGVAKEISDLTRLLITAEVVELVSQIQ